MYNIVRPFYSAVHNDQNPYEADCLQDFEPDKRGWSSYDLVFEKLITVLRPNLIVEFGSWKGASAIHMAKICDDFEIAAEIIAADPHVGMAGTWLHNQETMHLNDTGRPKTYEHMLANILKAKQDKRITPFHASSGITREIMDKINLKAEMVYVDGSHLFHDAYADLHHAKDIITKDGVILCDDYKHSRNDGVTKAIECFLEENKEFAIAAAFPQGEHTERVVSGDNAYKAILTRRTSPSYNHFSNIQKIG